MFCPQKSKSPLFGNYGRGEPQRIQCRAAGICPLSDVNRQSKMHTNRGTSMDAGVVTGASFGQGGA